MLKGRLMEVMRADEARQAARAAKKAEKKARRDVLCTTYIYRVVNDDARWRSAIGGEGRGEGCGQGGGEGSEGGGEGRGEGGEGGGEGGRHVREAEEVPSGEGCQEGQEGQEIPGRPRTSPSQRVNAV